jgi:hypothetical protein
VENFHFQFENPELNIKVALPRLTMTVTLQRQGLPLFLSLFTGQLVAFFIAALTYFLDFRGPIIRNRFALAVGAFFAAVANTYNISRYLPITNQFTFTGKFVLGTFTFIGLTVLGTVICHNYDRSNKHGSGVRFNFWWGLITILFFTSYLIYLFALHFID